MKFKTTIKFYTKILISMRFLSTLLFILTASTLTFLLSTSFLTFDTFSTKLFASTWKFFKFFTVLTDTSLTTKTFSRTLSSRKRTITFELALGCRTSVMSTQRFFISTSSSASSLFTRISLNDRFTRFKWIFLSSIGFTLVWNKSKSKFLQYRTLSLIIFRIFFIILSSK